MDCARCTRSLPLTDVGHVYDARKPFVLCRDCDLHAPNPMRYRTEKAYLAAVRRYVHAGRTLPV